MSGFTALNVEPEDTLEEEVDDTKEIQIEEAFKLYQNALKLHSQGPEFYDAANEAYTELFQSEVFKYPEVVTDYGHEQIAEIAALPTPASDQAPLPILSATAADSAANSLPQLIYLSYKNRGQFILDVARHDLDGAPLDRKSTCLYYYQYCLKSLQDSASALERDDTDLDLWKKAARVSDVLSSQRLVRFCLESVVAGDDETGEQTVDLSGLDEAFASGELLQVLQVIQDDTAVTKSSEVQAQDALLRMLQKSNDPYPFLPQRTPKLVYLRENQQPNNFDPKHVTIKLTGQSQAALADALAQSLGKGGSEEIRSALGKFVSIRLPSSIEHSHSMRPETDTAAKAEDSSPQKTLNLQPDSVNSISPNESAHSPTSYHSAPDEQRPEAEANVLPNSTTPNQKSTDEGGLETEIAIQSVDHILPQEQTQSEMRLPTRKRSSNAAGNEEPESRTKSKRLRARESLMEVTAQEEETTHETDYYVREQLAIIEDSDFACLTFVRKLLLKLQIDGFSDTEVLQNRSESEGHADSISSDNSKNILSEDMKQAVNNWTEDTSAAIMSGHGSRDVVEKSGGMSLFQRHLKGALPKAAEPKNSDNDDESTISFARSVNQSQHTLVNTAILWLIQTLTSRSHPDDMQSSYLRHNWSPEMKDNVIYVVMHVDGFLFEEITDYIQPALSSASAGQETVLAAQNTPMAQVAELVQTIFEIYLDEYYCMAGPESQLDENAKTKRKDYLRRWAHLAGDVMQICQELSSSDRRDDALVLRFLLASTLFGGLVADNGKAHVLSCLSDVRTILEQAGDPVITLPNNKAMSQVSVAAVDQEISRLSTHDFFNSVFDNDNGDPVAVIMKLEPILEFEEATTDDTSEHATDLDTQVAELRLFLDSGDASLKLFLWRRLQNGYTAISYTPKVVSCLLRSLEIIVQEIQTDRHRHLKPQERQLAMLRWLRDIDEIMMKILSKFSDEVKAFESLDESHLRSSLSAITSVLRLSYDFVKYDDHVRTGQISPPALRTSTAMKLFEKSRDKMRDTFVRGWTLMYHLIKEATAQFPEHFEQAADQLAEYLRLVHKLLGHRQYCKQCNKLFVKLAKTELLSTRSKVDYSEDIAQVLYDVYQVKLGSGFGDANHGCTPDSLGRDKETAFNLVPVIMTYARKLNMRELIKSDLKGTVEKIQQTLGNVKPSPALSFNRKAISTFLKSAINPQDVYRSLKGIGDLITRPVSGDYAKVAAQGWYQMLGKISLAKYKSIKRVNPTPTDDLDTAGTFLKLDLEHNITDWETWYRLAQVYDCKIEDSLIWNSLKINDSRSEIVLLERNAINAYTMAIAIAMRSADDSVDTVQKISDMFSEFAFRLYASSRPPLNMEAFSTDKHMRHLSSSQDQSMSKTPFIFPFKPYAVWGFAAYLLQRKFATGQKEWLCYYTLGKCFWKMFQNSDNTVAKRPVSIEDVLDACTDAVELVPQKEKSNDYILEPHYKLVSIVHKLVNRKVLLPSKGIRYLQATQFARAVHVSHDDQDSEWDAYILEILRKLGHADKSNWHHRITARAAHVNYDDDPSIANALGAKHQFTQQIFTKTMTMQVWKPEYERPGRHYVYTGRYLSFFVHLLDRLGDRAALEQLVRRIRRKTTDFLDHPKVWEETALTYVNLLRRLGKIPEGHERNYFDKISYEDFAKMSEKVEKWAHDPETNSSYQDIMQDAIELKRLNNSLMKGPAVDDLIGDAYACMYEAFESQLPPEDKAPATATTLPQGTFINMNTDVVPTGDDNLDRMRLNNLLLAQTDGPTSGLTSARSAAGPSIPTPQTGTPPLEPVRIPTPSKPGRIKTITRREIQRRAEACLVKPPPIKTPTLTKRPFIDLPGRRDSTASNLQDGADTVKFNHDETLPESSRVSSRRPSMSFRGSAEPDDGDRDADGEGGDDNDGEADDESELSDLDNDEDEDTSGRPRAPVSAFAQLMERKRKAEDNDEDEDGSDGEEHEHEHEQEQEDEGNDDNEGDETGAELGKDDMSMDEQDESVLEIQDSQDPTENTIEVQEPPESARKTRGLSRGGKA